MVIDTSAIIAILLNESDAETYATAVDSTPIRLISAVTRVELTFVMEGRKREEGRADLERLLQTGEFEVVNVTAEQTAVALDAFRRFGKGRHKAALNIGDTFAYALAQSSDQPLLFKGNDFIHTDVQSALTSI